MEERNLSNKPAGMNVGGLFVACYPAKRRNVCFPSWRPEFMLSTSF
jgi:hypothetical protein